MSQAFTPIARSRASYYCKGSPVHFSMVELFRMEETGETVVTLTFKNLNSRPLQRLVAHFRCKDKQGRMIGEDDFVYEDVNAAEGETFGFDDGVFVSDVPLGSVEASLVSVTYDGATHSLRGCPPVALPRPQALSEAERRYVEGVLRIGGLKYRPAQRVRRFQLQRGPRQAHVHRVRGRQGHAGGGRARGTAPQRAPAPHVRCVHAGAAHAGGQCSRRKLAHTAARCVSAFSFF